MKILVVSPRAWEDGNSFGNSFSNIFDGIDGLQFANIYCNSGNPNNDLDMQCYQIAFESVLRNLKNKNHKVGKVVPNRSGQGVEKTASEQKTFDTARVLRWQILFWARDFIWKIGRWKTPELRKFIDDFKPDLIFQPIYYSSYMNDIAQYVKECANVPMIGYVSDDVYMLRQFRLSPLYWLDRLWKRTKVKKTVDMCELLYVISDIQKDEYEKVFKKECKILTKCADFSERIFEGNANQGEIKLLYGGNIGTGRWKSLSLLAEAVERLANEGYRVRFDIYSGTPRTKAMKKALNRGNVCCLHEPIPYREILALQEEADILVHAEGLSLKSRLAVHQSFSTKLVDFFELGKCIFAIGREDVASIKHLKDYDAAVIAHSKEDTYEKLKALLTEPQKIIEYGEKAYLCGAKCHSKNKMQTMLKDDMTQMVYKTNEDTAN